MLRALPHWDESKLKWSKVVFNHSQPGPSRSTSATHQVHKTPTVVVDLRILVLGVNWLAQSGPTEDT